MSADPFSDILKFTNATSLVTGGFTAGGPWSLRFPAPDKIKFFAVIKGHCWVSIDGEGEPIRFDTGDVGLLAAKRSFVLSSDPALPAEDAMQVFAGTQGKLQIGDGADFSHIGGHILLDPASGRLLADVLPPWIHIAAASPQAANFRWLLAQLVEERRGEAQPGSELASAQLAQLLFIQILREHLKTANAMPAGWLRALADPRIAPAIRLMHAEPGRAWHLEELAKAAAMSRTTFAFHFKAVAGIAPLSYLAQWRMRLAERELRDGKAPVAAIAQTLGYTSESAFSNAFKRLTGRSPKAYRSAVRATME